MTKQKLTDLVLYLARQGMDLMVLEGGSFRQCAFLIDRREKMHMILIADQVLHGPKMRQVLLTYSLSIGGADAIVVQSDARFKQTPDTPEGRAYSERIRTEAAKGNYIIADDPAAQEIFITAGRSHEHTVAIFSQYTRNKRTDAPDEIVFDSPEPTVDPNKQKVDVYLIPDIWQKVN